MMIRGLLSCTKTTLRVQHLHLNITSSSSSFKYYSKRNNDNKQIHNKSNNQTNNNNTPPSQQQQQQQQSNLNQQQQKELNKQALYQQLAGKLKEKDGQFHESSDHDQFKDDKQSSQKRNTFRHKLTRNLISFGVFGILSLGAAVYMSSNDETEYLLKHGPRILEDIQSSNELSVIEKRLESLSECTANNNTMRKLMAQPENINHLLDIIETIENIEVNVLASRIIENASPFINDYKLIPRIIKMSTTHYLPAFVRKSLGVSISKIAGHEDARIILANNGAITSLEMLCSSKLLHKQIFHTALLVISHTCIQNPSLLKVTSEEMESIESYAKEEMTIQADTLLSTKRQLIESGWLLYLHTSAGGFIWGCFESLQNKYNIKTILTNGLKTSIITALVPIFFVGAMTTWYNNQLKKLDTTKEKFYLYFAGAYSLYPWYYLLPKIERFSPYWLGGHVVGFMSFFVYLVITKNEIFNSDSLIIQADKKAPPRQTLKDNQMFKPTTDQK